MSIVAASVHPPSSARENNRFLLNVCAGRFLDIGSSLAQHSERNQAAIPPRPHGAKEARQNHGRFPKTGAFPSLLAMNCSGRFVLYGRRSARNRYSRRGLDHSVRSSAGPRVFRASSGTNGSSREERAVAAVSGIHGGSVRVVHATERRSVGRVGGKMGRSDAERIAGDAAVDSREMRKGSRSVREKCDWVRSECASKRERVASFVGIPKPRLQLHSAV